MHAVDLKEDRRARPRLLQPRLAFLIKLLQTLLKGSWLTTTTNWGQIVRLQIGNLPPCWGQTRLLMPTRPWGIVAGNLKHLEIYEKSWCGLFEKKGFIRLPRHKTCTRLAGNHSSYRKKCTYHRNKRTNWKSSYNDHRRCLFFIYRSWWTNISRRKRPKRKRR